MNFLENNFLKDEPAVYINFHLNRITFLITAYFSKLFTPFFIGASFLYIYKKRRSIFLPVNIMQKSTNFSSSLIASSIFISKIRGVRSSFQTISGYAIVVSWTKIFKLNLQLKKTIQLTKSLTNNIVVLNSVLLLIVPLFTDAQNLNNYSC